MIFCSCGSLLAYDDCCGAYISGKRSPLTAELLMRSRYCAYVMSAIDYLYESTHPDMRRDFNFAATSDWAKQSVWMGLEILKTGAGGPLENTGSVEFIARYRTDLELQMHHEVSIFKRMNGRWYYYSGTFPQTGTSATRRNAPCPCGSGLKYKKCCAAKK
ncbi:MAG: hypothetical protein C0622_07145 [Desulfuromonas sp.]|nr:MAG: hypothetical protein C0622_07145 [Desulfuromonas sp.]